MSNKIYENTSLYKYLCKSIFKSRLFPTFLEVLKFVCRLWWARITHTTSISLSKWSKVENLYRKNFKNRFKTTRTILPILLYYLQNFFSKNRGVWKRPWAQNWAWSVVPTMRISEVLSWKWRHFHSKSSMFLADFFFSLRWLNEV
jgi:hypothetical protein